MSTCFAVSIESLEASLSRRIENVLKKSLRGNRVSLSSSFLSIYLAVSHFLLPLLESMRGRGLLLKGKRAKKITNERSAHTYTSRRALYIRDNSYAWLSHTHTYTHACRCICRNKPAALRSFDEKVGQGQLTFCALL